MNRLAIENKVGLPPSVSDKSHFNSMYLIE